MRDNKKNGSLHSRARQREKWGGGGKGGASVKTTPTISLNKSLLMAIPTLAHPIPKGSYIQPRQKCLYFPTLGSGLMSNYF